MKNLLFLAFIVIATAAKAQNTLNALPEVNDKVTYESIVEIPGKNKDFIFNAANKWMLDYFKNPDGRILSTDNQQGQILGKGSFTFISEGTLFIPRSVDVFIFQLQIDCRDNKYRIRLYNIFMGNSADDNRPTYIEYKNDSYKKSKNETVHQNVYNLDAQFKAVMSSLNDSVTKAATDNF